MKSKTSEKYFTLSSAGILLVIVFLYLALPDFSVSLNRSLEMIKSGSEKGLMMIYYQLDGFAFLFAAFTYALQLLLMVFQNNSVSAACYGLFEPISAKLILTTGGLMAMLLAFGLTRGLALTLARFKPFSEKLSGWQAFHQKYDYFWAVLIAVIMTASPGPEFAVIYCLGFFNLDMRRILLAAAIVMLLFL